MASPRGTMKILAVSDKVEEIIYSPAIKRLFGDVDMVIGCGDLPFYYLEFIVTLLGGPLFYVIGNHANAIKRRYAPEEEWEYPGGCENIDGQVFRYKGLIIAGLEGSKHPPGVTAWGPCQSPIRRPRFAHRGLQD